MNEYNINSRQMAKCIQGISMLIPSIRLRKNLVQFNTMLYISRYKEHEDFIQTVGRCLLREGFLEFSGMETTDSDPTRFILPENIEKAHLETRRKWFNASVHKFVEDLTNRFVCDDQVQMQTASKKQKKETVVVRLTHEGKTYLVSFLLCQAGQSVLISLPGVPGFQTVKVPGTSVSTLPTLKQDSVENYSKQLCQWILLLLSFKDAIKMGDLTRTNIHLKMLIPFFYSHSKLSKYYEDCLDYILKTEILLTSRLAMRVRAASFVNPTGGSGRNKEHDKETELQVQRIKKVIKGLISQKSESNMVAVDKVAPVLVGISENFAEQVGKPEKHRKRKHRTAELDEKELGNYMRNLRPFKNKNRNMASFTGSSNPFDKIVALEFKEYTLSVIERLKRGNVVFPYEV